jgi:hypothetical protein
MKGIDCPRRSASDRQRVGDHEQRLQEQPSRMVRSNLRRPAPREDETQLTNRAPGASPPTSPKLPELLRGSPQLSRDAVAAAHSRCPRHVGLCSNCGRIAAGRLAAMPTARRPCLLRAGKPHRPGSRLQLAIRRAFLSNPAGNYRRPSCSPTAIQESLEPVSVAATNEASG